MASPVSETKVARAKKVSPSLISGSGDNAAAATDGSDTAVAGSDVVAASAATTSSGSITTAGLASDATALGGWSVDALVKLTLRNLKSGGENVPASPFTVALELPCSFMLSLSLV